jgi:putative aminopeptidase FrvX
MATKDEMKKFAFAIDSMIANTQYTYLEAIVHYCKQTGLEIEMAASLINSSLKTKIESQAMENNMLKVKSSKLPI